MRYYLLFLFILLSLGIKAHTINPLQFGLANAKNGQERFEIIRRCHVMAREHGDVVSYEGIDTIYLDIPDYAEPIPLSERTDFAGTTLIVKTTSHDMYLFRLSNDAKKIDIICLLCKAE